MKSLLGLLIALLLLTSVRAYAQSGSKERIKVYSPALAGNLVNDPADRDVTVYLPPTYYTDKGLKYPVLYMLHGFTDNDSQWFGWEAHWINLQEVIDSALGDGLTKEMIVVMPNAYNRFEGSMYSTSATIGDWETFVVQDLVHYIDQHYRTLPQVESRGLAGHSMGGYGTIRLGMKYPGVFCALYLLSACCMEGTVNPDPEFAKQVEAIDRVKDLGNAPFRVKATLASAAAWAPNPGSPPLFLDLPYTDGELRPDIASKFAANRILNTIDQYIPNLKSLKAIGMDAGIQDQGISRATERLHKLLLAYRIPHEYESYEGNHINRIAERIRYKTLPFFSEHLAFD